MFAVLGFVVIHIARAPYNELKSQGWGDELINKVKRNFPIKKWVNKN
jgi:hypothetical protein